MIIHGVAGLVAILNSRARVRQTLLAVAVCGTLPGCVGGGGDDASQGWPDLGVAFAACRFGACRTDAGTAV